MSAVTPWRPWRPIPRACVRTRTARSSFVALFLYLLALGPAAVLPDPFAIARADWTPSAELQFRATIVPDTLTVGDPVVLELTGSAPVEGALLVPAFQDSVGPFTLLGSEDLPVPVGAEERTAFSRRIRLTAFRTGSLQLPPIPLLWVSDSGDTSVAYSDLLSAEVLSVLPDSVAEADPQAALSQIRDVKGVVPLEPSRLWLWILLGLIGAALLAWVLVRALRRKPAEAALGVQPSPVPVLPPEVAFHKGLDALLARKLVETGEWKEYYAELSLLLRRYVEGRFSIPAVEETQREIVEAADRDARIESDEVAWLRRWLSDADLVKFARMDRLSADAVGAAEEAARWVLESTRKAEERAREAARLTPPPVPAAVAGAVAGADAGRFVGNGQSASSVARRIGPTATGADAAPAVDLASNPDAAPDADPTSNVDVASAADATTGADGADPVGRLTRVDGKAGLREGDA